MCFSMVDEVSATLAYYYNMKPNSGSKTEPVGQLSQPAYPPPL